MKTRQQIAQELLMKEERIAAWEGRYNENYVDYSDYDYNEVRP